MNYGLELTQQDAILQPDIYTTAFEPFIANGGAPMDAVSALSESYVGYPSMIKVAADAASVMGIDCQAILRETVKNKLMNKFDPKAIDRALLNSQSPASMDWLDGLVHDTEWRHMIYELLNKYPRCEFLNFAIMRMAEGGYQQEVAQLRTASSYVKVYNYILNDAFAKLGGEDDIGFEENLPALLRVCSDQQHTYLYALVLIQRLYEEFNDISFLRLAKELEKAAIARGQHELVYIIKSCTLNMPQNLATALKAIRASRQPTPGDLMTIYNIYTSAHAPSVYFIRDYDFIVLMLQALYVPDAVPNMKPDLVDKLISLLAYATAYNDSKPRDQQEDNLRRVGRALKNLHKSLQKKTGANFSGAMIEIVEGMQVPAASMGILLWIEYISTRTQYYDTYYRTSEVPLPHLLLDEIASIHPLQQPIVLEVIKRCFLHPYQNFAPETLAALQKQWIERLVHLVELNYTLPVLKFIRNVAREIDYSLTVHFVTKVLELAQAPYSVEFVEHIIDTLVPIADTLVIVKGFEPILQKFIAQVQVPGAVEDGILTDELGEKMAILVAKRKPHRKSLH
ncbi:TH1 protein [Zychaea mexicana]|uniref:TH1 protein n=1 Tax=Zychaea mexicana TaxID=64656 RepID=UPI0022FEEE8D|nr:TH1 protein [Zychaea mexicana]KAI9499653.1 TH1 protein [Zychaea mexicana]